MRTSTEHSSRQLSRFTSLFSFQFHSYAFTAWVGVVPDEGTLESFEARDAALYARTRAKGTFYCYY